LTKVDLFAYILLVLPLHYSLFLQLKLHENQFKKDLRNRILLDKVD
jgi:hypothetical protein